MNDKQPRVFKDYYKDLEKLYQNERKKTLSSQELIDLTNEFANNCLGERVTPNLKYAKIFVRFLAHSNAIEKEFEKNESEK